VVRDLWISGALAGPIASVTTAVTKTVTTAVTRTVTTAVHRTVRRTSSSRPLIRPASGSSVLVIADLGAVAEIRLYDSATAHLLGTYGTRDAAYAAADEHSLELLARAGEWITVEHLVACVDGTGRIDLASEVTHVGPPDDLGDAATGCAACQTAALVHLTSEWPPCRMQKASPGGRQLCAGAVAG
jgi:hypothetical protein